jgi:hypothetical protein
VEVSLHHVQQRPPSGLSDNQMSAILHQRFSETLGQGRTWATVLSGAPLRLPGPGPATPAGSASGR